MIVADVSPQAVAHDNGAVVASTGRHSFVYALAGRTIALAVEPLDIYYIRLPETPTWDDGTALTQDEARQLLGDVQDSFAHWNERCEFLQPDDQRILRSLDQLVTYIRAEATR